MEFASFDRSALQPQDQMGTAPGCLGRGTRETRRHPHTELTFPVQGPKPGTGMVLAARWEAQDG